MASDRLVGVEAGRGIAALLVVALHASHHLQSIYGPFGLGDLFEFGHAGVDFFFVLSGFIILHVHHSDIGRPERLRRYIERRFVRIYPLYWIVLFVTICVIFPSTRPLPSHIDIVASFFLMPTVQSPVLGVAWTLQHELIFYAAFACLIVNRRFGLAIMGLWFAYLVWNVSFPARSATVGFFYRSALSFNFEFFLGMFAAHLLRTRRLRMPGTILFLGVVGFVLVGATEDMGLIRSMTTERLGYGASATLIVLGLVQMEREGRLNIPWPLFALGSASYATYLTHLLSIGFVWKLATAIGIIRYVPISADYVVLCFGAVLIGVAVRRYVELPVMSIARDLIAWRFGGSTVRSSVR